MEDYYRLHTIFAAVDRRDRVYDLDPEIVRQRLALEAEIGSADQQLRELEKQVNTEGGEGLAMLRGKVGELEKEATAKLKTVPEHGYHSRISRNAD